MTILFAFEHDTHISSYILASILAALAIYSSVRWTPLQRLLSARWFQLTGKWSYCIYLFHTLIGGLVVCALQNLLSKSTGVHQAGFVIIGVLATAGVSATVYQIIEKPSIAFSKRIKGSSIMRVLSLRTA